MTTGTGDNPTPPAKRRRRVLAGRLRLGMVLSVLCLTLIGSVALVLVADHFLFRYGTWSGWTLEPTIAQREDIRWWQSRVGPLPPAGTTEGLVTPAKPVGGRDGWNRAGVDGLPGMQLSDGLAAYSIETSWPMVRGKVLLSPTTHVWRMGLSLPGGMVVERVYTGRPGWPPPHPSFGGWTWRIRPLSLVLNTLYAAGPVCILVTLLVWVSPRLYRGIRRRIYRARGRCPVCGAGRCPDCGHVLTAGQSVCPECGYEQRARA
jgi:hypothetical protein